MYETKYVKVEVELIKGFKRSPLLLISDTKPINKHFSFENGLD